MDYGWNSCNYFINLYTLWRFKSFIIYRQHSIYNICIAIIDSFFNYHKDKDEMSLCDPIAVICLFFENLFSYKSKEVDVDISKSQKGLTSPTENKGKIDIAIDLDTKKVMNLIDKNFF